jgi:branched-chain amino acid transport system substrate-binding protein
MKQSVAITFRIGSGNFQTGFPLTVRVVGTRHTLVDFEAEGLPPAPHLPGICDRFEQAYNALGYSSLGISLPEVQVQNVSRLSECQAARHELKVAIDHWLHSLHRLQLKLIKVLGPAETIRFFVQTDDDYLRRLPWQVWDFLEEHYPNAEVVLSTEYKPSQSTQLRLPVRILAIEGDRTGTRTPIGLQEIKRIEGTDVTLLQEPNRLELEEALRFGSWDMLFFIGHSRSRGKTGEIAINSSETILLEELHELLKLSGKRRLKFAMFNSCDGVGIASMMADAKIPYTVVMRHRIPDVVAKDFLTTFLKAFAKQHSLHDSIAIARSHLQQQESIYPCASWLPVIYQNPTAPEIRYPKPILKRRRIRALIGAVLAAVLLLLLWLNNIRTTAEASALAEQQADRQRKESLAKYQENTSMGEHVLLTDNIKFQFLEKGTAAYGVKDYEEAYKNFSQYRNNNQDNPEVWIYQNNAKLAMAKAKGTPTHLVAVSVPIKKNPGTAEEMLRGVAQAQEEMIDQVPTQILIINDENSKHIIPAIAPAIIGNKDIMATIGPNAIVATRESALLYSKGKLLLVTPSAFSTNLPSAGEYVYRMLPPPKQLIEPLAIYVKKQFANGKLAACRDERSGDNKVVLNAFTEALESQGVSVIPDSCDISKLKDVEKAKTTFQNWKNNNVKAIFIAPYIEEMDDSLLVASQARAAGLAVIGSPTFIADKVLGKGSGGEKDLGGEKVAGMLIYSPWSPHHAAIGDQKDIFTEKWKRHVTWRTATSYDAFQAVTAALAKNPTREGVYQAFKDYQRSPISGKTGPIQFTPTGDRMANNLQYGGLLTVGQVPGSDAWQFLPVEP